MNNTKQSILTAILNGKGATIAELAKQFGINGITVRHHLIGLTEQGLVTCKEERHGVGRPHFVYHLTDKGVEQFPSSYLRLMSGIFETMQANMTAEDLKILLSRVGERQAKQIHSNHSFNSLEDKLKHLREALSEEGYRISYEHKDNKWIVYNENCPYLRISSHYPEICNVDDAMFNALLGKELVKKTCIRNGDRKCTFILMEEKND